MHAAKRGLVGCVLLRKTTPERGAQRRTEGRPKGAPDLTERLMEVVSQIGMCRPRNWDDTSDLGH